VDEIHDGLTCSCVTGVTYCAECDALPFRCEHDGDRYLPAMHYQHAGTLERGENKIGTKRRLELWHVPDAEKWRCEHPPSSWPYTDIPSDADAPAFAQAPAEPEYFGPVTTTAGERARLEGIRLLRPRYEALAQRAGRRRLTTFEEREMRSLAGALETLAGMSPLEEVPDPSFFTTPSGEEGNSQSP
jgi:hypothetical protein